MPYRVLLFVQGRGWVPLSEITGRSDVVETEETGLKLGCTTVLKSMERTHKPLGSSSGDLVGFKLENVEDKPQPADEALLDWRRHSHFFYRRGNAYMLYKTWSWPD
ncbi:MAG: hypothetical protein NZ570_06100 [Candidatus Caldarchaeum sp.]|nr:hypothetical protein [Candidatus Caldarchaeum sp.]MDW8360115.1 hypothetical protein [Candidatus Caldarchaeum sp.]